MKSLWEAGGTAHGVWTTLADPVTIGLAARAGFDYTCIDMQHGLVTASELPVVLRFLAGSGTTPIVRVPSDETAVISRALDLGARGVVLPMVDSAEQAALAAEAVRYPGLPGGAGVAGRRSWGPIFADLDGVTPPDRANDDALCIAMIETPQGFADVERIAAVDGVDVLYVGPYDLALSTGHGQVTYRDDAEVAAMIQHVVDTALAHGKIPAVHCTDLQMVRDWRARGARMLTTGLDTTIVREAMAAHYRAAVED